MDLLQKGNTPWKMLSASDIATQISATEASIAKAIRLFTVCGHPIDNGLRSHEILHRLRRQSQSYERVFRKELTVSLLVHTPALLLKHVVRCTQEITCGHRRIYQRDEEAVL